jgi:hypothetical protein
MVPGFPAGSEAEDRSILHDPRSVIPMVSSWAS